MSLVRKKLLISSALFCLQLLMSGCFPALQNNTAELEKRARNIKSVKMLSPEIKIYELSAGDVSELRDDWSVQGKTNAEKAISDALKDKGIGVSLLQPDSQTESECEEVMALYKAVINSVYTHTVMGNPNLFPDKVKNFDYTVGSLEKVLGRQKNEGLLIVFGSDEISSAGRKALRVVQAVNPFAPTQQSEVIIDNTSSNQEITSFEVKENKSARIDGHQGFRAVFAYKNRDGLRIRSVYYGFMDGEWFYGIRYTAPQRHYFDKDLKTFEKVVASLRLARHT